MRARIRLVLALVVAIGGACVRVGSYECTGDDACTSREGGRCEATSWCSYPDDACDSKRRYGEHAGALANSCTEPSATTGTTGDVASTTTATTTATTGVSSSSSDGSSSSTGDTPQPGDATWVMYRGAPQDSKFHNVVEIDTDDFVVCGSEARKDNGNDILLARYDKDGAEEWAALYDYEQLTDVCQDLLFSSGGSLFATGQRGSSGGISTWVGCYRPEDGTECWHNLAIGFAGRGIAYTIDGLVVVAGSQSSLSGGVAMAYHSWGDLAYEHALPDTPLVAALAIGGTAIVGGERLGDLFIGTYTDTGVADLVVMPGPESGPNSVQRLASDGESIYAVGYVASTTSIDPWFARYTLEGAPVWERGAGEAMLDEEYESLAIDPGGDIFVVGFVTEDDHDTVVSRWSPDGELVWSRKDYALSFGDDIARDIVISSAGDLLVVGEARTDAIARDGYAMRVLP